MGKRGGGDRERDRERDRGERERSIPILIDGGHQALRTPSAGWKQMVKRLRAVYKPTVHKAELSREALSGYRLLILPAPRKKLDSSEIKAVDEFLREGGSVMVMAGEGGLTAGSKASGPSDDGASANPAPASSFQHLNKLLETYGIVIENDSVVRTVYHTEFFHPKQAFIREPTLTRQMENLILKAADANPEVSKAGRVSGPDTSEPLPSNCSIVYPYGCSLSITRPGAVVPVLSSGPLSFPANRALAALTRVDRGYLMVMGTSQLVDDEYINKANNWVVFSGLLSLLCDPSASASPSSSSSSSSSLLSSSNLSVDPDRAEFSDKVQVPDVEALSERLRLCLHESDELPSDFTALFDHRMYSINTKALPESLALYDKLNVKHAPLTLIPPQFEVPLPPLQPAVFLPNMRELPPPSLDLFDLDDHFASEKLRLAQVANKYAVLSGGNDLAYLVKEFADVLNIHVPNANAKDSLEMQGKRILEVVMKELVSYKKIEQDAVAPVQMPLISAAEAFPDPSPSPSPTSAMTSTSTLPALSSNQASSADDDNEPRPLMRRHPSTLAALTSPSSPAHSQPFNRSVVLEPMNHHNQNQGARDDDDDGMF